jgi:hypothetical protein
LALKTSPEAIGFFLSFFLWPRRTRFLMQKPLALLFRPGAGQFINFPIVGFEIGLLYN